MVLIDPPHNADSTPTKVAVIGIAADSSCFMAEPTTISTAYHNYYDDIYESIVYAIEEITLAFLPVLVIRLGLSACFVRPKKAKIDGPLPRARNKCDIRWPCAMHGPG